jgi:hypothetical protein
VTTRKFAAIGEASDGRQVLFYIEPDGDDFIMHQVCETELGQVDLKVKLKVGNEDALYDLVTSFDSERADRVVAEVAKLLEGVDA